VVGGTRGIGLVVGTRGDKVVHQRKGVVEVAEVPLVVEHRWIAAEVLVVVGRDESPSSLRGSRQLRIYARIRIIIRCKTPVFIQ